MAETVTIPAVGQVDRRYVIVGVLVIGGIVGYVWWQRTRAGGAPVLVDAMTGLPVDPTAQGDVGYTNPRPVQSVIDTTDPDQITTNPQWTQKVIDVLGAINISPDYVGVTMGKYLAGQPLTFDEAATVRTAWALVGKPPEGPETFTLVNTGGGPPPVTQPPPAGGGQPPPPAGRTYTVPSPMTIKDVTRAVYGSYTWNGNGGRLYYANEFTIVTAARAAGVTKDFADFRLPAGTVLTIP